MPADDDIDNVGEMWFEMSVVVLSNDHQHLCDGDESVSQVRLLEKVTTEKKENVSHVDNKSFILKLTVTPSVWRSVHSELKCFGPSSESSPTHSSWLVADSSCFCMFCKSTTCRLENRS